VKKIGFDLSDIYYYPIRKIFRFLDQLTNFKISKVTDRFIFLIRYIILASKIFVAVKLKKNIQIEYDNSRNAFTFGEFFETVMFVRFLSHHTSKITFNLIQRHSHTTLANQDPIEIEKFDKFQYESLSLLDKSKIDVNINVSNASSKCNIFVLIDFCYLLPGILNLLIRIFRLKIPGDFLLNSAQSNCLTNYPYIAWHVRSNKLYDSHRNANEAQILNDYRSLISIFPNFKIMLFSTTNGLEFVRETLKYNLKSNERLELENKLINQPVNSYLGCIPYVTNSKFYFQRAGGGMGNLAIYSSIPFLIISQNYHYYFSRGTNIGAWNKRDQIYIHKVYRDKQAYLLPLEHYFRKYFSSFNSY
jgi:hypothetical protein